MHHAAEALDTRTAPPHARTRVLSRYTIVRGAPASALPAGLRQDTRKHTRHVLRPEAAIVEAYLARPSEDQWLSFERAYTALLEERFSRDRAPFDALAALARTKDVLLGCNCPTRKNPDLVRCHTILALRFMKARYPDLEVRIPSDLRSP